MLTSPKDLELDAPIDEESVRRSVRESITRNGLILRDEAVLQAMGGTDSYRYYARRPSPTKKPVAFGDNALTVTEMGALVDRLEQAIVGIGSRMCKGEASAHPTELSSGRTPCQNCAMKPFCRSAR